MEKQEFLDKLRLALNGKVAPETVSDTVRYYEEYISTEVRMGKNEEEVMTFLKENPDIKGIAVLNSRGYIIADLLKAKGIRNIVVASFDLTGNNRRCLEDGSISALLCQRPELQGFNAIKSSINHLLYKQDEPQVNHLMPIDILMKENLPFYRELFEI